MLIVHLIIVDAHVLRKEELVLSLLNEMNSVIEKLRKKENF